MELGEQGCGGRAMSAVPAPFVAAATEEEVGCLWSLGHGAHRLGGGGCPTALQCPSVHAWWKWRAGMQKGGLCTFQGLGPRGEACLSEVFPEAHFLRAAQDVVS